MGKFILLLALRVRQSHNCCVVAHVCYNMSMTTKTAFVRARIEPSIKKKAETVLSQIGISPSEAINVFYRRIANDKEIPFSLSVPNAETRKALDGIKNGKYKTVSFEKFAKEMRKIA